MKRYIVQLVAYDTPGLAEDADGDTVMYDEYARILAQRDRLAALLRAIRPYVSYANAFKSNDEEADACRAIDAALAELDKEKQS